MLSFEEVYALDINVDSYSVSNCMLWRFWLYVPLYVRV